MARSMRDLLGTLATIAERKKASNPFGDTTSAHNRLMLTVLSGLAEFEPEVIRICTGERCARAETRCSDGTPSKMTPHLIKESLHRREVGKPMRGIARTCNVSHDMIPDLWLGDVQ